MKVKRKEKQRQKKKDLPEFVKNISMATKERTISIVMYID